MPFTGIQSGFNVVQGISVLSFQIEGVVDGIEKGALLLTFLNQSKQLNIWRHTSYLTVSLAPYASLCPAGPVFREQDMHRLFDKVVAEHASGPISPRGGRP